MESRRCLFLFKNISNRCSLPVREKKSDKETPMNFLCGIYRWSIEKLCIFSNGDCFKSMKSFSFVVNLSARSARWCIEFAFYFISLGGIVFFFRQRWTTAALKQPWLRWEGHKRWSGNSRRCSESELPERKYRMVQYLDLFSLRAIHYWFFSSFF